MKTYRVMHLIDHMGPGGAQRIVRGLVLGNTNHYAAAFRKKGTGQNWEELPRFRQPRSRLRGFAALQMLALPRILRREKIDILHCHLNFSWLAGLWLVWVLRGSKLRVVFHEHDPNELNVSVYRHILARASKGGRVVAISRHVQERLVQLGVPEDRIRVLRNYVAPSLFTEQPRKIGGDDERGFAVGFAGRLVERKGWRHFLDAAKLLESENVRFRLAGDGTERKAVKRRIERDGLTDQVELLGHVSDMKEFFRSIDIFLMPATAEPMGLVQLEAQAAGVPVIAFNIAGINETLSNENAILVEPGNIDGIIDGIEQLERRGQLYEKLSRNGQKNAERFSYTKYVEELDIIYREALS